MPWTTPTLRQVREMVRDDIATSLSGAVMVGNSVLRVIADAQAGLARLCLKFIEWLSLQIFVYTAEKEWLDRHGDIWLVNADGSTGRKAPGLASGTVTFEGTPGISVPEGTEIIAANGVSYETLEEITLGDGPTEVAVRALNEGEAGNLEAGTLIAIAIPLSGVNSSATVVDLRGGIEEESDDDLRARILFRIQKPPQGGDADDYVYWATRVPAVTRAWSAPREMGMGTITLRFMCDGLRADNDGFPIDDDIDVVTDYLDTVRPVAIRDFFVEAPVPEPINFSVHLVKDSMTLRANVEDSVHAMLHERAKPAHAINGELQSGTTIYNAWVSEAIARVTTEFTLYMDDHDMPHNGALAVLGTVTYLDEPA